MISNLYAFDLYFLSALLPSTSHSRSRLKSRERVLFQESGSWHPGVKPDQLILQLEKKIQTGRWIGNDQDG